MDYYGYLYSDFCDEMSPILQNNETVTYITNPSFEVANKPTKTMPMSNNTVSIIIGILTIPALIFIFLILKGTKILSYEKTKRKN